VDRRVRRSRRLLADALLSLVTQKQFSEISIQDITDEADMNRSTFYLHFQSKEELLMAALVERFDELVGSFGEISPERTIWETPEIDLSVYEHVAANAPIYKALLGDPNLGLVIHTIIGYVADMNEQTMRASLPAEQEPAFPIEILAQHIAGSLYALIHWWLRNDMVYTPAEMAALTHQLWSSNCGSILQASS
ncbi:MAG: TetR/AcrR family transcriptional regulator, partial [Caldilineaceae bacterium]|nr:TetR/AcrR family transcriptional regulator [Caldilineaceae bacterium]